MAKEQRNLITQLRDNRSTKLKEESLNAAKPFEISKALVFQAYQEVKSNRGSAGIDQESIQKFELNLKDNLYKIWNRLSSGSYFPPAVKEVRIAKKSGGIRILGIPTVSDRVAQTVVKLMLEPILEPIFDENSFGYRPGRSAHDAVAITRERCWKYDFVVEFDIKGLFDNIDYKLLMKALRCHCNCKWILLYIERWLTAPMQDNKGNLIVRDKGTPQGGVVSPILANLFLHYAFDAWVKRELPNIPFCRYSDDGLLHCRSKRQAKYVLHQIAQRFCACGLEIHPDKSGIIYCKDKNRLEEHERISFDFLGFTFRPRRCVNKQGVIYPNFLPAISKTSRKEINRTIRDWRIQTKNTKTLWDLSKMFEAVLKGWYNYYGRFYSSAMNTIWRNFDEYLARWVRRKYKRFARHKKLAYRYLERIAKANTQLFTHWKLRNISRLKSSGSRMS
jgi:RNA-directed DNA polymerase